MKWDYHYFIKAHFGVTPPTWKERILYWISQIKNAM